jgi:hypothetical protein
MKFNLRLINKKILNQILKIFKNLNMNSKKKMILIKIRNFIDFRIILQLI